MELVKATYSFYGSILNEPTILAGVFGNNNTIFDTYNKAEDTLREVIDPTGDLKRRAFQNYIIYLLIAPYTEEKVTLLKGVETSQPRELEAEELLSKFVKKFLTFEICPFSENEVETQMNQFEPF